MKKTNWIWIFTLVVFSSCIQFKDEEKNVPKYNLDIKWQLETKNYLSYGQHLQDGKFLYFEEGNSRYTNLEESKFFISKVDLEYGNYVWQTEEINGALIGETPIILFNQYVCVFTNGGRILIFDQSTGELLTTVFIGANTKEINEREIYTSALSYENYLIWNCAADRGNDVAGIQRLDMEAIDFSLIEQTIVPHFLWGENSSKKEVIWNNIVEQDGIIYFQTNTDLKYPETSDFYAVDIKSGEQLWKIHSNSMIGNGGNSLRVLGNKLYSFDTSLGLYDLKKGTILKEVEYQENEIYLGGLIHTRGYSFHNGYFFYTTASSVNGNAVDTPKELIKNIFCIRASDLTLVWCDLDSKTGSLFSRPIVENNKVFVFCCNRLRVYSEEKGELLGINDDIKTGLFEFNAQYNGNVIFFNLNDDTKTSVLTAIKA